MANIVAGIVVAIVFFGALGYIISTKKKGNCVGCGSGNSCHSHEGGCASKDCCSSHHTNNIHKNSENIEDNK